MRYLLRSAVNRNRWRRLWRSGVMCKSVLPATDRVSFSVLVGHLCWWKLQRTTLNVDTVCRWTPTPLSARAGVYTVWLECNLFYLASAAYVGYQHCFKVPSLLYKRRTLEAVFGRRQRRWAPGFVIVCVPSEGSKPTPSPTPIGRRRERISAKNDPGSKKGCKGAVESFRPIERGRASSSQTVRFFLYLNMFSLFFSPTLSVPVLTPHYLPVVWKLKD